MDDHTRIPKSPYYVFNEDDIRIGVTTALSNIIIGVAGVLVNELGEQSTFRFDVAATNDRVETVTQAGIGAGHILHCQAFIVSGSVVSRSVYVSARIIRNSGVPATPQATLLSGYVDNKYQPAFPYCLPESAVLGRGNYRSITGTDPAANVEVSETVPTGALWKLHCLRVALVTDANAANRRVTLTIDDGTTVYYEVSAVGDQAASLTHTYSAAIFGGNAANNLLTQILPLPGDLVMRAGHRIKTVTTNRQATDNFGAPQLLVEEWLET